MNKGEKGMTRAELDTCREGNDKIRILQHMISEIERGEQGVVVDCVKDYRSGFPRTLVLRGINRVELEKCKKEIRRIQKIQKGAEEWITNINDVLTRNVFAMYYLKGLSWRKISSSLRANSPDYYRIRIRDKYLSEKGIK